MKSEIKHLLVAVLVIFIAVAAARSETSFYFSGPHAWVAGGETEWIGTNDGTFEFDDATYSYDQGFHMIINTTAGEWWMIDMGATDRGQLQVGTYTNATRFPFNEGTSPGLDFSGCGRGDNQLTGSFNVLSIAYSNDVLVSAAIDFVQYDEGNTDEKNIGSVRYNYTPPPNLSFAPASGFASSGPVGGPFSSPTQTFELTNAGGGTLSWSIINTSVWLNVSQSLGSLAAGDTSAVTVTATSAAASLAAGDYQAFLVFSNATGTAVAVPFELSVGQLVLNSGFETGDLSDWVASGTTNFTFVTNGVSADAHFGTCGALLGAVPSPGYLTQDLATTPGQSYVFSFWLCNPTGGSINKATPNMFQARWDGNLVCAQTNITTATWTQYQFNVTASSAVTPIQFCFEDEPAFLALDDVSVSLPSSGTTTTTTATVAGFSLTASACLQMTWATVSGQDYQLQYATKLSPPDWTNQGSPVTASASTLTLTDTNSVAAAPQRFYRLSVVQ